MSLITYMVLFGISLFGFLCSIFLSNKTNRSHKSTCNNFLSEQISHTSQQIRNRYKLFRSSYTSLCFFCWQTLITCKPLHGPPAFHYGNYERNVAPPYSVIGPHALSPPDVLVSRCMHVCLISRPKISLCSLRGGLRIPKILCFFDPPVTVARLALYYAQEACRWERPWWDQRVCCSDVLGVHPV
jgi:hypothetical protein